MPAIGALILKDETYLWQDLVLYKAAQIVGTFIRAVSINASDRSIDTES
jgi:hypothetical protein